MSIQFEQQTPGFNRIGPQPNSLTQCRDGFERQNAIGAAAIGDDLLRGVEFGETRFQMLARVNDIRRHVGVTIKADVPDSLVMPTWVGSYAGANWHERETHEMFGIVFDGHPDLRNLYLPGAFEGYPLRKDFPLLSRMVKPWPGIVDVEPMPGADDEEGGE